MILPIINWAYVAYTLPKVNNNSRVLNNIFYVAELLAIGSGFEPMGTRKKFIKNTPWVVHDCTIPPSSSKIQMALMEIDNVSVTPQVIQYNVRGDFTSYIDKSVELSTTSPTEFADIVYGYAYLKAFWRLSKGESGEITYDDMKAQMRSKK
jgi:hypothetical protein